jgi:hypothetical protein
MADNALDAINGNPVLQPVYNKLIVELQKLGPIVIEPKKTSIHVKAKSAFVGIHPRKNHFIINIVAIQPIQSKRVLEFEQVSKSRFHNHIKIGSELEIDDELNSWFKQAYELLS